MSVLFKKQFVSMDSSRSLCSSPSSSKSNSADADSRPKSAKNDDKSTNGNEDSKPCSAPNTAEGDNSRPGSAKSNNNVDNDHDDTLDDSKAGQEDLERPATIDEIDSLEMFASGDEAALRKVFDLFDSDGSGSMSSTELGNFLRSLGKS